MLIKKLFCCAVLLTSILGLTASTSFAENVQTKTICTRPYKLEKLINSWLTIRNYNYDIINIDYDNVYGKKYDKKQCAHILYQLKY